MPIMSSSDTTTDTSVLIVSDVDDVGAQAFFASLIEAHLRSEIVPDVYAATARLAGGAAYSHVIVDMRSVDSQEAAFLRLVRRFYPDSEIVVPAFEGVGERLAVAAAGFDVVPVDRVLDQITTVGDTWGAELGYSPDQNRDGDQSRDREGAVSVPEEGSTGLEEGPLAKTRGSDQGYDSDQSRDREGAVSVQEEEPTVLDNEPLADTHSSEGPSLYEAVRERMSADGVRSIRRRPPSGAFQNVSIDGKPDTSSDSTDETLPVELPVAESSDCPSEQSFGDGSPEALPEGGVDSTSAPLPPAPFPPAVPPSPPHSMLSPEEMDALLTDDNEDVGVLRPKHDAEGGVG